MLSRPAAPRGTARAHPVPGLVPLALVILVLASCAHMGGTSAPPVAATEQVVVAPLATVQAEDVVRRMQIPGSIRAEQEVILHAQAHGFVTSITKDRGDRVAAGDIIATLDIPELTVDREGAQATLALADADMKRLDAIRALERTAVTDQDLDVQRAKHATATAAVKRIDALLGFASVRAPFAGMITERFVDPGALVQQSPIVRLVDVSKVRVLADVPEAELRWITVGTPCEVRVASAPGKAFAVTVSRMASSLDVATRTLRVELDRPNADLALLPGMYATVLIDLERHTHVLAVPVKAVVMEQGKPVVYTLVDGKAVNTPVTTGISDGLKTEILSGLTDQQTVIIAAALGLKDGMRVRSAEAK